MAVRLSFAALIVMLCCAAVVQNTAAQDEAEENPYRPGLVASYTAGGPTIRRLDETVAFDWQDAAPDPRLPAGEFAAMWRGRLWAQAAGTYRVLCFAQGTVEIKLAGKVIVAGQADQPQWISSQPLELPFDRHELEISFRKTGPRAQLALFWSGPDFRLEPIAERFLLHDREQSPPAEFERGRQLATALRCAACHRDDAAQVAPAPALDRLSGNVHEAWLAAWLPGHSPASPGEAATIAAWLLREPAIKSEVKLPEPRPKTKAKNNNKKKAEDEPPPPSAAEGERVLLTRGCLACHQLGGLGESGPFGGGDLTKLAEKRPADFLLRWLSDPAAINRSHRMPEFTFTGDELKSLDLWWRDRGVRNVAAGTKPAGGGEKLVTSLRCNNCHVVKREDKGLAAAALAPLTAASDWSRSCAGEAERAKLRPGYRRAAADQAALQVYYSQPRPSANKLSSQARGRDLLVQLNCLACHQREGVDRAANSLPARLQDKLATVATAYDQLAPLVPAMTPPALNGVGDKLLDAALVDSIRRQGRPHRPYLLVQMPKFNLDGGQLANLTAYFTATDRVPSGAGVSPALGNTAGETPAPQLAAAGPRLVTADGLSCTSCHQVGSVQPSKAPLNARGPDISLLEKRIRREWFDRWCDNPARIVPRMEMPAVKIPVRGVLNEKVAVQLAAVWHILNTPGFEPPEPNPVRVLRLSGVPGDLQRPVVIRETVKSKDTTWNFPVVIGLGNRNNVLFDLTTNRLAAWWLGDTARQRTKGKSWYWEPAGNFVQRWDDPKSDLRLVIGGKAYGPTMQGQNAAEIDYLAPTYSPKRIGQMIVTQSEFQTPGGQRTIVKCSQSFDPLVLPGPAPVAGFSSGFRRNIVVTGMGPVEDLQLQLVDPAAALKAKWIESEQRLVLDERGETAIRVFGPGIEWHEGGWITINDEWTRFDPPKPGEFTWEALFELQYETRQPVDQFIVPPPAVVPETAATLEIAPQVTGVRLPLSPEIMPSALAWNDRGQLIFATLKGEVIRATDKDGDGIEDSLAIVADGLPTPYGIAVSGADYDVLTKMGLERMKAGDHDDWPGALVTVAAGWGYTEDYHDWAVGLIKGDAGEYYLALPCQQDARSDATARLRGKFLKLVPRPKAPENHRLFDLEVVSAGHRFPMGIARNRAGEMFVTDNQGNYNPFNELNHIRKGAHFGFINALEKEQGFKAPPLAEPAIDIPHPWTRSVNGICFLETPAGLRRVGPASGASAGPPDRTPTNGGPAAAAALSHPTIFGPLEGQLVGCEYDTRRLIRMSLQKVGDTFQGAAYPLSLPPADVEKGLLGPIVCAVKPTTGELYVGEIRDSGWGAGNNIGQIVKIKIEPEKLPCGIAEVRATSTGFTIDFLQPVDKEKAGEIANYSLESYRRESTPAYGGSDIDRRIEKLSGVDISPDGKRATLTLSQLRAGHVYELKLKNLAPGGGTFFPDEAHYTLRKIP